MRKKISLLILLGLTTLASSAFATEYTLLNNSSPDALTLVYDQTKDGGCKTQANTQTAKQGQNIKFDMNTNFNDGCLWGYLGYKIMNGSQYIGYLSINVTHAGGKSNYDYYIKKEYTNGSSYVSDFGYSTKGTFQ